MSIPNNPLSRVVRASCAKWPSLKTPFGATRDETQAVAAQRNDYAENLYRALVTLEQQHRPRALPVIGKVLGEVEAEPYDRGVPEVRTLTNRVRNLLGEAEENRATTPELACAPCRRDGGYRVYSNGPLMSPVPAMGNHWRGTEPPEPMCATHYQEWAYLRDPEANVLPHSMAEWTPGSDTTRQTIARFAGGLLVDEEGTA